MTAEEKILIRSEREEDTHTHTLPKKKIKLAGKPSFVRPHSFAWTFNKLFTSP